MIRNPESPRRRKGSGALEGEKGTNIFSTSLCLSDIRRFFLNSELLWQQFLRITFFKPRANDYTTKQLILVKGMFFLKLYTNDYISRYTEELYKKDLHDLDNHDGVITHLEPDILECEVKWA